MNKNLIALQCLLIAAAASAAIFRFRYLKSNDKTTYEHILCYWTSC